MFRILSGISIMSLISIPAISIAAPVPSHLVPNFVPSGARQADTQITRQQTGWTSVTPWGESINTSASETGFVELLHWQMSCISNGQRVQIATELSNVGAALYEVSPWYGGDRNTPITVERTSSGIRMIVKPNQITHWWLSSRPRISNGQDCEVVARLRMSPTVMTSIGGDWWLNQSTGWQGQDIANHYMGRSDWYDHQGGWQTLKFPVP